MKLSEKDMALYQYVDEVLFYLWDSIGVSDSPEAREEYHSYFAQIFLIIKNNGPRESVTKLMARYRTEDMGVNLDDAKDR